MKVELISFLFYNWQVELLIYFHRIVVQNGPKKVLQQKFAAINSNVKPECNSDFRGRHVQAQIKGTTYYYYWSLIFLLSLPSSSCLLCFEEVFHHLM